MSTESTERLTKKISELNTLENISDHDVFIVSYQSEVTREGETVDNNYISKKIPFEKIYNSIEKKLPYIKTVNDTSPDNDGNVNIDHVYSSDRSDITKKLEEKRTISLTGDITGSTEFDGTRNVTINTTVKDNSHNHSIDNINNLQNKLNEKTNIGHKHSISDINELQNKLNEKANKTDIKLSVKDFGSKPTIEVASLSVDNIKVGTISIPNSTNVKIDTFFDKGTHIANLSVDDNKTELYIPHIGVANMGIGSIIAFAGDGIPDNTLLCDGREISKSDYNALWLVIGDKYGKASDSSKFKLPNLTDNRFIEGSTVAGTYKDPGLPNITGSFGPAFSADGALYTNGSSNKVHQSSSTGSRVYFNANRSSNIYGKSTTVQPAALTMKYVIVYKQLAGGNVTINSYNNSSPDNGNILPDSINNELNSIKTSLNNYALITYVNEEIKKIEEKLLEVSNLTNGIYVVESDKFNSSDGEIHEDDSENDSWYRLYSDGWCEQGGLKKDNANNVGEKLVIKLNKKLNDGYNVIISNASSTLHYVRYTCDYTSNSFSIASTAADSVSCDQYWEAKGFIKIEGSID